MASVVPQVRIVQPAQLADSFSPQAKTQIKPAQSLEHSSMFVKATAAGG